MKERRGFSDVNGTQLYYEIAGEGHPLVLIHGFTVDHRYWDDQFADFSRDFQVLRYDLRGFGKSAAPSDQPYGHHDDLKALMDFLRIEKAHVLGHSLGGLVAINFAIQYPQATSSLVVVGGAPEGFAWTGELQDWMDTTWRAGKESGIEAARRAWLSPDFMRDWLRNPRVAKRYSEMFADYSGWHWVNDDEVMSLEPLPINRLEEIRVPTLIVVEERVPLDYHRAANLLQQRIPGARKAVLREVGHFGSLENPKQFDRVVREFLLSLER